MLVYSETALTGTHGTCPVVFKLTGVLISEGHRLAFQHVQIKRGALISVVYGHVFQHVQIKGVSLFQRYMDKCFNYYVQINGGLFISGVYGFALQSLRNIRSIPLFIVYIRSHCCIPACMAVNYNS